MTKEAAWYTIHHVDQIDSPALVIYPERVKENIRIAREFVPETERLRPHIKTNKNPEVCKLLLNAGIKKFKCATIAEAEMLAMIGARDVLLAYQPVGPKAIRMADLSKKYPATKFSCIIDDSLSARHLSDTFEKTNQVIHVFIDLNIGMNRTGIIPEKAEGLFDACSKLQALKVAGLHAYDGHHRDPNLEIRTKQCNEGFLPVESLRVQIEEKTGEKLTVIAGGTPTFPIHAKRQDVECSPGTFIYWDKGYEQILKEQPYLFAALVITRIISKPNDETICVDLGHKSIAAENLLTNRVYFLNAPELVPIGHSEEHLVLKSETNNNYRVGDVLYGVPHHICPTVALHDRAAVIGDHQMITYWNNLARTRTITI